MDEVRSGSSRESRTFQPVRLESPGLLGVRVVRSHGSPQADVNGMRGMQCREHPFPVGANVSDRHQCIAISP